LNSSDPLARECVTVQCNSRYFPSGMGTASHRPVRMFATVPDNGIVVVARFAAKAAASLPSRHDGWTQRLTQLQALVKRFGLTLLKIDIPLRRFFTSILICSRSPARRALKLQRNRAGADIARRTLSLRSVFSKRLLAQKPACAAARQVPPITRAVFTSKSPRHAERASRAVSCNPLAVLRLEKIFFFGAPHGEIGGLLDWQVSKAFRLSALCPSVAESVRVIRQCLAHMRSTPRPWTNCLPSYNRRAMCLLASAMVFAAAHC